MTKRRAVAASTKWAVGYDLGSTYDPRALYVLPAGPQERVSIDLTAD